MRTKDEIITETTREIEECEKKLENLRKKLEEEKKPEKTYHIGQRFYRHRGQSFILAQVECKKAALIDLDDGNRAFDPVLVNNVGFITETELKKMYSVSLGEIYLENEE